MTISSFNNVLEVCGYISGPRNSILTHTLLYISSKVQSFHWSSFKYNRFIIDIAICFTFKDGVKQQTYKYRNIVFILSQWEWDNGPMCRLARSLKQLPIKTDGDISSIFLSFLDISLSVTGNSTSIIFYSVIGNVS